MLISQTEARIIAHEYIDGVILNEFCTSLMSCESSFPKAWLFDIYHINEDKDEFHTVIEITNNGIVSRWDKTFINDENDM